MTKLRLSILLLLTVFIGNAQDWQTDFETAKKIALEKNQNIVLVFQGSDWCAPCIKLDREIWSTSEFKTYAEANFILLKADFPRKKKNSLIGMNGMTQESVLYYIQNSPKTRFALLFMNKFIYIAALYVVLVVSKNTTKPGNILRKI